MDLEAALAAVAGRLPGTLGVAIRYLPDGPDYTLNADHGFYPASVIKLPVLVEVFAQAAEGRLDLARRVSLRDEDRVEGSGVLQYLGSGLAPTVRDLAELMIVVSDNSATNMLIDLAGVDAINARMRTLGLPRTTLAGKLFTDPIDADGRPRRSLTTPREMRHLVDLLWRGQVVSAEASATMLQIMAHQQFMDLIRYLPVDDLSEADGRAQSGVIVASKSGAVNGVRNDVGLITARTPRGPRSYIVSAFTGDVQDDRLWTPENVAVLAVGEVSRLAYHHLLEDLL